MVCPRTVSPASSASRCRRPASGLRTCAARKPGSIIIDLRRGPGDVRNDRPSGGSSCCSLQGLAATALESEQ